MSENIQLDKDTKVMLLRVLKRGCWLPDEIQKLKSQADEAENKKTSEEIYKDLERIHRSMDEVIIDGEVARKLARQGLLDFDGSHNIITEDARRFWK